MRRFRLFTRFRDFLWKIFGSNRINLYLCRVEIELKGFKRGLQLIVTIIN